MIDLYLKATDEQDLIDQLSFARSGDEWIQATHNFALDVIGVMPNNDGVYDESGEVITPATIAPGYHANIRCADDFLVNIPVNLIIDPVTPNRIWA